MLTVNTISSCNRFFAVKTLNPLVSLIRLSSGTCVETVRFGFYTVWFKRWDGRCPDVFGHRDYDFSDGTLITMRPGETAGEELIVNGKGTAEGTLLCFHPSMADPPGAEHSFFRYSRLEALHLSSRECMTIRHELDNIGDELGWGTDEFSTGIIRCRIGLLLDYISRFYMRQFITRHDAEGTVSGGMAGRRDDRHYGCSPDYFNDGIRLETGKCFCGYAWQGHAGTTDKIITGNI